MYFRFFIPLLCISLTIGSCKSPAGSKLINNPANKSKKTDSENSVKNSEEDLKDNVNQLNKKHCKPSFTLKDTTIQGGNTQNMMLEVKNLTEEGYTVKSIAITKSTTTTSYTKQFGLDELKNTPIPPSGLAFTISPPDSLKTGSYTLKMKAGKTGTGCRATEQFASCTITIPNKIEAETDPVPKQQDSTSSSKKQGNGAQKKGAAMSNSDTTDQPRNEKAEKQEANNPLNQDKDQSNTEHRVRPGIPDADMHTFNCKLDENLTIQYHLDDTKSTYLIQSVKMIRHPDGKISTRKKCFGLDKYSDQKQRFNQSITIYPTLKTPATYKLTVQIEKKDSDPLFYRCYVKFFK